MTDGPQAATAAIRWDAILGMSAGLGSPRRATTAATGEPMLSVELSIGDFDGQAVVALRGESNLADTPDVASHLIAAVAACGPSVIVDLAGLEGIDYSGLSVLLRIRKWTRQNGGDMPLAALQQPVRRVLEATGLIDVFSVYSSVEEAANSLRQAQA